MISEVETIEDLEDKGAANEVGVFEIGGDGSDAVARVDGEDQGTAIGAVRALAVGGGEYGFKVVLVVEPAANASADQQDY